MKTVITGSRTLGSVLDSQGELTELSKRQQEWMHKILKDYFFMPGRTMINGMCPSGVDAICADWVQKHNKQFIERPVTNAWFRIKLWEVPAEWHVHGKSAGFKRNTDMAEMADNCLAIWDGKSRGTKHMIDECLRLGRSTHVFVWREQ